MLGFASSVFVYPSSPTHLGQHKILEVVGSCSFRVSTYLYIYTKDKTTHKGFVEKSYIKNNFSVVTDMLKAMCRLREERSSSDSYGEPKRKRCGRVTLTGHVSECWGLQWLDSTVGDTRGKPGSQSSWCMSSWLYLVQDLWHGWEAEGPDGKGGPGISPLNLC